MADRLQDHLTAHGLATEPVDLPALRGRRLLARPDLGTVHRPRRGRPAPQRVRQPSPTRSAPVSERCARRSGFAENFDALTGAGLRDRAYTWTAAVYLLLAADHVQRTS